MCQVSLRLKEVQKGNHDFKYNKVTLFAQKPWNINTSMSAATILALVPASRYYCGVTWSYHNACAKFLKHDFKYNKVPIFARKTRNINTSMFAAPKLALVPASCYYCDVT